MPKNRRLKHRRPPNLSLKRKARPLRMTLSFFAFLGVTIIGAAVFFNFLVPNETQSSIDWSAHGVATRHEYNFDDEGESQFESQDESVQEDAQVEAQELPEAQPLPEACAPMDPELTRMTGTIKNGDTPSSLLEGHLELSKSIPFVMKARMSIRCNSSRRASPGPWSIPTTP